MLALYYYQWCSNKANNKVRDVLESSRQGYSPNTYILHLLSSNLQCKWKQKPHTSSPF